MQNSTKDKVNEANSLFLAACENADKAMARQAVRQGARVDVKNAVGETALHLAVKSGSADMVRFVAEELTVNINSKDAYGRTPLHWAAQKGDAYMVEALILAGANIHAKDNKDLTVRTYADMEGHRGIVNLLSLVAQAKR